MLEIPIWEEKGSDNYSLIDRLIKQLAEQGLYVSSFISWGELGFKISVHDFDFRTRDFNLLTNRKSVICLKGLRLKESFINLSELFTLRTIGIVYQLATIY